MTTATDTLTAESRRMLALIDACIKQHGYAPTLRELAAQDKRLSPTSFSTAQHHVQRLHAEGLITYAVHPLTGDMLARTMRVTPAGRAALGMQNA